MVAEQNVATMQVYCSLLINQMSVLYWPPESNYKYSVLQCGMNFEIFFNWTFDHDTLICKATSGSQFYATFFELYI